MTTALWLLAIQGVIGAFDTFYYHEWRARLPARPEVTGIELRLHAARDFLYAAIFGTLPWLAFEGVWAAALVAILVAEIALTMADFVIEVEADHRRLGRDRRPQRQALRARPGLWRAAALGPVPRRYEVQARHHRGRGRRPGVGESEEPPLDDR